MGIIDVEQLTSKAEDAIFREIERRMINAMMEGRRFIVVNDKWLEIPRVSEELKNFKVEKDKLYDAYLMHF